MAVPDDIPAIMGLERGEGFAGLVGRWSAEEHADEMASGSEYRLVRDAGKPVGFALLQKAVLADACTLLRRIAVAQPGRGYGSALLRDTLRHCFETRGSHRVELMVYVDNARARAAYAKAGFCHEGILRDIRWTAEGGFRSMDLMSILRPEWEAGATAR
jgi:RimJ/RimL family protein N-acetyltransferase